MNDTVLIAGAGLSAVAGLPTTKALTEGFLGLPPTNATPEPLQQSITAQLRRYWDKVFHYGGGPAPSFEDHFTVLDLAANTGHYLGTEFSPKQLRAIRRLSIHRVFDVIDQRFNEYPPLRGFLEKLAAGQRSSIVTTNWDISLERHLWRNSYDYSIPMHKPEGGEWPSEGIQIFKLHGSSNWAYCDCCGRLFAYNIGVGKGALHDHIFIDEDDLAALDNTTFDFMVRRPAMCGECNVRLSSRVATFSYAKTLNFVHFLAIWENAFKALRQASNWIFIGYSFPEADFQLRHMLKAAQLGHGRGADLKVTVVTKGEKDGALERFRRFFGKALVQQDSRGFEKWVEPAMGRRRPPRRRPLVTPP